MRALLGALILTLAAPSASAVVIDWVTVGSPGNACDPQSQGCFGAVAVPYRIARTEVRNDQYAEFLNAVARTDPNGLYATAMGSSATDGGITRTTGPEGFVYATIPGRENMPVFHVSFYDAIRFANWLHNGQPVGDQTGSTTESGAYTITAQGIADNDIVRNVDALVTVASEDEWFKAAYYDPDTSSYFNYPAGSDSATACTVATATANRANCNNAVGGLTEVGSYTGSASPFGTFDQGGNVPEWNDTIVASASRGTRGGIFNSGVGFLAASNRSVIAGPGSNVAGFRVTSPAPAPSVPVMAPLAGVGLILGLVVAGRRRL